MRNMHDFDRDNTWENSMLRPVDGAVRTAGNLGGDAIIPNLLPNVAIYFCHSTKPHTLMSAEKRQKRV